MYLLETKDLKVHFPMKNNKKAVIKAVDGVSFKIPEGKTFGLVGESGCGKSTTARAIIRLYQPTAGEILFEGNNIAGLKGKELKEYRKNVQMVFQDPYASLNPRMTVNETIMDPMKIYHMGTKEEMQKKSA